jgi:hypothetical protein
VTPWKEALYAYAEANCHSMGRALAKEKRFVRPKPTLAALSEEYPEVDNAHLQGMLAQEIAAHIKLKRKDEDDEGALFALIGQVTSDEGLARVRSLTDYAATAEARNAYDLLQLVISEHTLMMHHASRREAKYLAVVRYMKNKQSAGQSDEDYAEKFHLARANMKTLSCKFDPDDEDDALQFLMNMDTHRHGEFMRDVINRERAEANNGIPKSVQGVIEAARKYISTPKTANPASSSLVYLAAAVAQDDKSDKSAVKVCGNCKKPGHYARACTEPCGTCMKTGHSSRHCPDSKGNDSRVMISTSDEPTESSETGATDERDYLFGHNFNMRMPKAFVSVPMNNKRKFTIDSYASESFVFAEDLLVDCADDRTMVHGFHGLAPVGRRGYLPGVGPTLVSPEGGVNGLALDQLEERYTVTYTQRVSYVVNICKGFDIVFNHDAEGRCYSCMFDDNIINKLRECDARFKYNTTTAPTYCYGIAAYLPDYPYGSCPCSLTHSLTVCSPFHS